MEASSANAYSGNLDDAFLALLEDISRSLTTQVSLAGNCLACHPHPSSSYRAAAEQAVSRLRSAVTTFVTDLTWASAQVNGPVERNEATQDRPLGIAAFAAAPKRRLRFEAEPYRSTNSTSMADSAEGLAAYGSALATLREQFVGNSASDSTALEHKVNLPETLESQASRHLEVHGTEQPKSDITAEYAKDFGFSFNSGVDSDDSPKHRLTTGESDEMPVTFLVRGVLNPNWIGRLTWDFGVIAIVLVDVMVLPFQIAYKHGTDADLFDVLWLWIATAFFAADIVMNCFTAYTATDRDEDRGKLVTQWSRIMRNYFGGWFGIDFVSTIPWSKLADVLAGDEGAGSNSAQIAKMTKVVKFVRFLRLMRMLRLAKLGALWERIESKMGSLILLQVLALIRVLFIVISICHWNACIWWMIGQPRSLFTELLSDRELASWDASPHWTTVPRSMGTDARFWSWGEKGTPEAYVFCFYWTLGVMRTMPSEVTPVNLAERIYVMLFMFFAVSAFAISVTLITQAFLKIGERKRVFNEDLAFARMHLRRIKASTHLQNKVKEFLIYLFNRRRIQAKEQGLFGQLPQQMLRDMRFSSLKVHLNRLDLLKVSPKMQYLLSEICEIRDLVPGEHICRRGKVAKAAWILMSGHLSWQDQSGHPNPPNHSASVVDEECLLTPCLTHSKWTVLAIVCSEVLYISKRKFLKILKLYGPEASAPPLGKASEASTEASKPRLSRGLSRSRSSTLPDSDDSSEIAELPMDSPLSLQPACPEAAHVIDEGRMDEKEVGRMSVKSAHTAAVMSA